MRPTDRFRRQHRELQQLAGELLKLAARPSASGRDLQQAMARFTGKLKIHAVMETEALYPPLLAQEDRETRQRVQRLHASLEPIYAKYYAFDARWSTAELIEERKIRFRTELARVIHMLGHRMMEENRLLYPIADELL